MRRLVWRIVRAISTGGCIFMRARLTMLSLPFGARQESRLKNG
jgi:hypothetical protein